MIITALADIHGSVDYLPDIADELSRSDLVLIAGDITNFGTAAVAADIIARLREYNRRILAVPGNCDRRGVGDYLSEQGINLEGNCIKEDGFAFVGTGGSLPCPGTTPNEADEDDFEIWLTAIESEISQAQPVILLTHQPAWGTLVDTAGQRHTGSKTIRSFIERTRPVLAVSGHIHEARGTGKIGQTTLVNPGPFRRGLYAQIEITDRTAKVSFGSAGKPH